MTEQMNAEAIAKQVADAIEERFGMVRTTHVVDYKNEIGEMVAEIIKSKQESK